MSGKQFNRNNHYNDNIKTNYTKTEIRNKPYGDSSLQYKSEHLEHYVICMVAKQCLLMLNQFISAFTFDVVRFILSKKKRYILHFCAFSSIFIS